MSVCGPYSFVHLSARLPARSACKISATKFFGFAFTSLIVSAFLPGASSFNQQTVLGCARETQQLQTLSNGIVSSRSPTGPSTMKGAILQGTKSTSFKILHLLRHGQAQHNPRAEAARSQGCSFQTFLDLMKEDDALDAALTDLGREQARNQRAALVARGGVEVELVVSSPLSRAIDTADIVFPRQAYPLAPRLLSDSFREVSGLLVNAKRRSRSELIERNAGWDVTGVIGEEDTLWTPDTLETDKDCAERGYVGLQWLWQRPETNIALVAHGGLFHHLFGSGHESVLADDQVQRRFENCELRTCRLTLDGWAGPPGTPGSRPVFSVVSLPLPTPPIAPPPAAAAAS